MKDDLSEMMCLDVYLASLNEKNLEKTGAYLSPSKAKTMPLLSWNIFIRSYFDNLEQLKIDNDIEMIKMLAEKTKWKNDIDGIFENEDFEALIVTDLQQDILWVNKGFTEMTGYSKKFALNKKPNFLQGKGTSLETKKRIGKQLKKSKPFTEVLTNYKKDSTPYECEVKIIPLYNKAVTHYLALEKQIV